MDIMDPGWRGALSPLENGDRERWPPRPGYSQLGEVGQIEPEMSDRLNSCGLADRQRRPWSATGAGGS
jgi:hypothetical protein